MEDVACLLQLTGCKALQLERFGWLDMDGVADGFR
jgi:hypothetical protein